MSINKRGLYVLLCGEWVEDNVFYRIGVINDYRSSFSFIEYRKFGILESWSAGSFRDTHRGFEIKDDCISVFLNYQKVGVFKSKEQANQKIKELINKYQKELTDFEHYLITWYELN